MPDKKKGILVVSFGTSHEDTRKKTIDAIVEDVRNAYPDCAVYEAWTSKMIIRKLAREGCPVMTVSEAMEQIVKDGVTELVVQPTHVINGIENDRMKQDVLEWKDRIPVIRFGTPLLTCEDDSFYVIDTLMQDFGPLEDGTALVFMGHGTTHYANTIYAALDYQFKDKGYPDVYVGTVEAYPSMETLQRLLKEGGYRRLILAPFMIVAGDHAKNDMASDDDESWRCQFERAGYEVTCVLRGLGESKGVRNLFLKHIEQAAGEEED